MTTMMQLLVRLPPVTLDARAPAQPAGIDTAPDGAASFGARLLQAISAQSGSTQTVGQPAENPYPALPQPAAPSTIASILEKSAAKVSETAAVSVDATPIRELGPEPEISADGEADADIQQLTPPLEQPQPQPVAPPPVTPPQATVVALVATASIRASKTEAAAVEAPLARRAALETSPGEQREGATQTPLIRFPPSLQNDQKAPISAEPAAPDAKALPTEMPSSSISANTSILDVSVGRTIEPEAIHRALDLSNRDWTARLSQEIVAAQRSDGELAFRLTPQHLGTLEIGLTETAQGVIVELQASKEEAAQIIARDETRLVEELRQRGVPVAEVSLRNGAGDDGRNPRNGANPAPQPPLTMNGPRGREDQDQLQTRERGRLA
jgi:flagellar hook-length control protein FliK